jgi:hypothetical protein
MTVSITICNLALGELRAPPIVDIAENTLEAQNCARYYPQCLKLLLEQHDWSFATKIATLAALTDNPRASEWAYAYALPVDCATPKRIIPPVDGTTPVRRYWPFDYPEPRDWWTGFIVEAGVFYSQVSGVILEYSANDIDEDVMPAMFVDALTYALAARLAVPLRDSRETKGELLKQAEIATQRAVADDMAREPQRDAAFADEVKLARGGGC